MLRPLPPVALPSTVKPSADSITVINNLKRSEGIAVTKAGERHCRWPIGDPRSPDFRFCGCNAYESLPYCIDHARMAYQNVGKRQRANESEAEQPRAAAEATRY